MWKSIKKFFKWIADHTGISWIARKILSGWNNVRNWWSGNKVSQVSVAVQTDNQTQEPTVQPYKHKSNSISEAENRLILSVSNDDLYTNLRGGETLDLKSAYIQCDRGKFKVTFEKSLGLEDGIASYIISSIELQKDELVHDPRGNSTKKWFNCQQGIKTMRGMIGLDINNRLIHVTKISKGPIIELMPEVPANGNTPNSTTTSPEAEQLTAGAGHSK